MDATINSTMGDWTGPIALGAFFFLLRRAFLCFYSFVIIIPITKPLFLSIAF
jgi:hypothetical protein